MHAHLPITIRRSSHNISRSLISPNALRIMYRLRDNGYKAFLVGGSVRDLLLERTPKDFDLATDATPTEIKKLFRNCRLIGRRFRLAHLHFKDEIRQIGPIAPHKAFRSWEGHPLFEEKNPENK